LGYASGMSTIAGRRIIVTRGPGGKGAAFVCGCAAGRVMAAKAIANVRGEAA